MPSRPSLLTVARQWGRIGCIGFGGPPTHIALLRELCVDEAATGSPPSEFEDGIAACNLLPGPASTQLAIFSAWRVAGCARCTGRRGRVHHPRARRHPGARGVFLAASPPTWVLGAAAGAGAAVAAVAVRAGIDLLPAELARFGPAAVAMDRLHRARRSGRGDRRSVARGRAPGLWLHRDGHRATPGRDQQARAPPGSARASPRRSRNRRTARRRVGGVQGRCAVVRRRVRDHPA